jgi:hypothetical protein
MKPLGLACLAFFLVSALSVPACSGGTSTGGARVALALRVTSDAGAPYTTAVGWNVTLSQARLSAGASYYFDGEPILSRRPLLEAFPTAHAHPGHYVPGEALGQSTSSAALDLLAPETTLAAGEGVAGLYRSARFTFGPARFDGRVVQLEGIATKGEARVAFRAEARATEVSATVEGCPFTEAQVAGNGTVQLLVRTEVWLDQVDFGVLGGDGATPVDFGTTVAANAFRRGLEKSSAYTFSFTGDAP